MLFKLFSPFDYYSALNVNCLMLFCLPLLYMFFFSFSMVNMTYLVNNVFYNILIPYNMNFKGFSYCVYMFFSLLLFLNFSGLAPYIFSLSSQFFFILFFSVIFFLVMVFSSFFFFPMYFFAKFTPQGSPNLLIFLLKIMELVSLFIRPLTLSLRLSINMTTGHMFVSLISFSLLKLYFSFSLVFFLFFILLFFYSLFELFVSFIQAFVYSLLLNMYMSEHIS